MSAILATSPLALWLLASVRGSADVVYFALIMGLLAYPIASLRELGSIRTFVLAWMIPPVIFFAAIQETTTSTNLIVEIGIFLYLVCFLILAIRQGRKWLTRELHPIPIALATILLTASAYSFVLNIAKLSSTTPTGMTLYLNRFYEVWGPTFWKFRAGAVLTAFLALSISAWTTATKRGLDQVGMRSGFPLQHLHYMGVAFEEFTKLVKRTFGSFIRFNLEFILDAFLPAVVGFLCVGCTMFLAVTLYEYLDTSDKSLITATELAILGVAVAFTYYAELYLALLATLVADIGGKLPFGSAYGRAYAEGAVADLGVLVLHLSWVLLLTQVIAVFLFWASAGRILKPSLGIYSVLAAIVFSVALVHWIRNRNREVRKRSAS